MKLTSSVLTAIVAGGQLITADSMEFGLLAIKSGPITKYANVYSENGNLFFGSSDKSLTGIVTDAGKLKLSNENFVVVSKEGHWSETNDVKKATPGFAVQNGYLTFTGTDSFYAVKKGWFPCKKGKKFKKSFGKKNSKSDSDSESDSDSDSDSECDGNHDDDYVCKKKHSKDDGKYKSELESDSGSNSGSDSDDDHDNWKYKRDFDGDMGDDHESDTSESDDDDWNNEEGYLVSSRNDENAANVVIKVISSHGTVVSDFVPITKKHVKVGNSTHWNHTNCSYEEDSMLSQGDNGEGSDDTGKWYTEGINEKDDVTNGSPHVLANQFNGPITGVVIAAVAALLF